jgi:5,10-methenyltetrahydrofolate synthetase
MGGGSREAAESPASTEPGAPTEPLDKASLRRRLIAARRALPDAAERAARLEAALVAWLARRPERVVGAYWPIRSEFDPLPALGAWLAAGADRRVGLPVIDPERRLAFRAWTPGCAMTAGEYGIPIPAAGEALVPGLLLVPCVGFGPGGVRLGYGGGFYDRTLAVLAPRPATLGIAFASAFVPDLAPEAHDIVLDAILTEVGVAFRLCRGPARRARGRGGVCRRRPRATS